MVTGPQPGKAPWRFLEGRRISGQGLGMAFKCVYRKWANPGAEIFKDKNNFIDTVLETYKLINEIAEKPMETGV